MKRILGFSILIFVITFSIFTVNYSAQTRAAYLNVQTKPASLKSPREILVFLNVNAKRLSPKLVDTYLLRLISLQSQRQKTYEAQLYSPALNSKINNYQLKDLIKFRTVKDEQVKSLVYRIYCDGFRLYSAEGMIGLEKDFPKLEERFAKFATRGLAEYLDIMATETNKHFAVDAALRLTPDELANRISKIEKFQAVYSRFPRLFEVKQLHRNYLTAYLIGLNNTPAFNYQTNRLEKVFLMSFQRSVRKYRGTQFARLIKDYLIILEKNNWQKSQEILDFVKKSLR